MGSVAQTASSLTPVSRAAQLADFLVLTKARVNVLVVATTWVGFALRADSEDNAWLLLHTLGGTGAVAAGAAVANQVFEREFDQKMLRTQNRPVATGKITPRTASVLSGLLVLIGCVWLALGANGWASLLAGISFLIYAFIYTPLKRLTAFCIVMGAVAGALPFLVGWVAAGPQSNVWAVSGFAILFLWQIPHFLAIAWWRREEYASAGFHVLPRQDQHGKQTATWTVLTTLLLLVASTLPGLVAPMARWYVLATIGVGTVFALFSLYFALSRTIAAARVLFIVSLFYLPTAYALLLLAQKQMDAP